MRYERSRPLRPRQSWYRSTATPCCRRAVRAPPPTVRSEVRRADTEQVPVRPLRCSSHSLDSPALWPSVRSFTTPLNTPTGSTCSRSKSSAARSMSGPRSPRTCHARTPIAIHNHALLSVSFSLPIRSLPDFLKSIEITGERVWSSTSRMGRYLRHSARLLRHPNLAKSGSKPSDLVCLGIAIDSATARLKMCEPLTHLGNLWALQGGFRLDMYAE